MTNKRYLLLAWIMASLGVSCSIHGENYPINTLTPVFVTQLPTNIPTQMATTYFMPLGPTSPPSPTAMPPYPTASVVKSNAVAFIAEHSLWIANVDGSGERRLVENVEKSTYANYFLRWSPDGKWISYLSKDEMWIISPDGSAQEKILAAGKGDRLMAYQWSPDGLQIAYVQINLSDAKLATESVRILNLKTGKTYAVSTHSPQLYGTVLRWSPNEQFLAFNKDASFILVDAVKHKVKQEILTDVHFCSSLENTAPVWSPNSEYFFHMHSAAAHYTSMYVCTSNLDGSTYRIESGGTILSEVVWDKTGNSLYFVAGRIIAGIGDPNLNREPQLYRYDTGTQKITPLLSLNESIGWSVSISPDGRTLEINELILENQRLYTLMDLKSQTIIKKFVSELNCNWSVDNENFICISQSLGYSNLYILNIPTGEINTFSGSHLIESWIIPPIATAP